MDEPVETKAMRNVEREWRAMARHRAGVIHVHQATPIPDRDYGGHQDRLARFRARSDELLDSWLGLKWSNLWHHVARQDVMG
jgi:hypothetical protein